MAKIKKMDALATLPDTPTQPVESRSAKKRIKARYDRHMPDKKHHRVLVWSLFLFCAIVIAGQLLYPPDRALPLTRIANEQVGWREHAKLAELITGSFRNTRLELVVDGGAKTEVVLATVGAEPNTEAMIERVVDYPFWQRFIPLSIFVHAKKITYADMYFTASVLEEASKERAAELTYEPVNARLAIENGSLVATAEKTGREVSASLVYEAIAHAQPILGRTSTVRVSSIRVDPAETAISLQSVRSAAELALEREISIAAEEYLFRPDDVTVASWLQIGTDEAGRPALLISDDKLQTYFDVIDEKAGISAGQTNINLVNGREVSRETGTDGRLIDRELLKDQITAWLFTGQGQSNINAVFLDVAPSIIYDNKYTTTEDGLRAYVTDASRRLNVRIGIQQLDGEKWSASARASESIPSASTYKLFVAKWLFDEMDKESVHWDDPMLDTTVSECFDRMTIASTNACSQSWLAQIGRETMNQYVYGLGFSKGTTFTSPIATHSTVNDLQRMMIGISDGTIITGAHRERLLYSLATHPYRYGIPTGSSGQVWDKVGFLWDYIHDTAIVKHPKGSYVMTIMTKGHSYGTIASLTREIERIMYP